MTVLGQRKPHAYKTFHRYDVLRPEYLDRPDYIETMKQEHARRLAYDALDEGFIEHKVSEGLSGQLTLTSTLSVGAVRQNTDTALQHARDMEAYRRNYGAAFGVGTALAVDPKARPSAPFWDGSQQPKKKPGSVDVMGRRSDQIWLDDVCGNSSAAPAKDTAASALQDFADYVADLELKLVEGASATVFFHAIKTELTQRISKGT
jgi:hypothetical protein